MHVHRAYIRLIDVHAHESSVGFPQLVQNIEGNHPTARSGKRMSIQQKAEAPNSVSSLESSVDLVGIHIIQMRG